VCTHGQKDPRASNKQDTPPHKTQAQCTAFHRSRVGDTLNWMHTDKSCHGQARSRERRRGVSGGSGPMWQKPTRATHDTARIGKTKRTHNCITMSNSKHTRVFGSNHMAMNAVVLLSGGAINTAFLGVVALSSLWYCYIRQADLAIRRREVRMNVVTTTLTLTAGVIGSYLSARTRRDSIAHAMAVQCMATTKESPSANVRRRQATATRPTQRED